MSSHIPRTITKRNSENDKLPKIDWVMERQFPSFFDMIKVRYKTPRDVPSFNRVVK